MGYVTGTEGIVMKQDKILKILKGVYNRGDPPLSIPNREVKPLSADGTALWWESRLAPNCESELRDRKSTRLNSSHNRESRMPSSA